MKEDRSEQSLTRTEWQLTGVVGPSTTWSPPPEVDAVLRFDGEGELSATARNHYGAPVLIDGDVLHIGTMVGTHIRCVGAKRAVEQAFLDVVNGEVRWAISGDELRLDKPDGRGLRFCMRDTVYPSRELRPLLQGQDDRGDYRFGWQAMDQRISLEWEGRSAPGKPWGVAIMTCESTSQMRGLEPAIGLVGSERFVFGCVPSVTTRVVYQPPDGQAAVELELFTVPGAQTWRAFGGFVDRLRDGAVVIALDDHGRELGRSHRLGSW